MGIFLIILILLFVCWPLIRKWMQRFMARRAEDFIRKATGMPPRPGSREERRQQKHAETQGSGSDSGKSYYNYSRRSGSRRRTRRRSDEPIIPREYAVDVEFVETKEFSETTIGGPDGRGKSTIYHESQVSDAEWVEIKKKG